MKDLVNATVTIANTTNMVQSFVPYAQSFRFRLQPQSAISFEAKSVEAMYYTKQISEAIAAQAVGDTDVKIIAGTYDGSTFSPSETYMYVGGYIVGEIPYITDTVDGLAAGNRIALKFTNPEVGYDELPSDVICKVKTVDGEDTYTKDNFLADGSFIYVSNIDILDKEVQINWGNGFVAYPVHCGNAKIEAHVEH